MNESNLKSKAIKGLLWSLSDMLFNQGLTLIIQIILARMLLPEQFGTVAVVMVFVAIANIIVDSGFSQALIREKIVGDKDYNTIFNFNLFLAVIIYFILFYSAFGIEVFFGYEDLNIYIKVVATVVILNALSIIPKVIFTRAMDFKIIAKINAISNVFSSAIAIFLAIYGLGIWALILQRIVYQLFQAGLCIAFQEWRPKLYFSLVIFKKYYNFGYKLLISGLIDTLYNQGFVFIIGKQYTQVQLGYYSYAEKLRDSLSVAITVAIQKVTYPMLSRINTENEDERLKHYFKKVIKITSFINFPLMLGLAAVAEPLFLLIFGEKWLDSVFYFQLLCLAGMLYPLHALNVNMLQVKGRSDLFLILEISKKAIGVLLIFLSIILKTGIEGLVMALVGYSFAALIINILFSKKVISYTLFEQLRDITPAFLISTVMFCGIILINSILDIMLVYKIGLSIILGGLVYSICMEIIKNEEYLFFKSKIKHLISDRWLLWRK